MNPHWQIFGRVDRHESLRRRGGSVLVIVLVTLVFATSALLLFVERAGTDLMVDVRDADRMKLRQEAYSALETTLAVLVDFKEVLGGLHSPAEGWSDPLGWCGYEPRDGYEVKVAFQDESGKLPLSRADFQTLVNLFVSWGTLQPDAELWADSLLGWMKADYTPVSYNAPQLVDYERADLGFRPPGRPLRSFQELRAIETIRKVFFDEAGKPNELGRRFAEAVSLFDYASPNVNSAPAGVLAALGGYDETQQGLLSDYRNADGMYRGNAPGYFTSADEVARVLGEQGVAAGFGAAIEALRVTVTVSRGASSYRLSVVISPSGRAKVPKVDPIPQKKKDESTTSSATNVSTETSVAAVLVTNDGDKTAGPVDIEYPFTLLEIREIDAPERTASVSPVAEF